MSPLPSLPSWTRRSLLASVAFAGLLGVQLAAGCVGSTGSERFTFEARAGGAERDASRPLSFTNDYGWEISLSKASLTFGPVYLSSAVPLQQRGWRGLLLGQAWADDGHLGAGRVIGEVLGQVTVDALDPTLRPFPSVGDLTAEQVNSLEIWFYPPPGTPPETTRVSTAAVEVAGVAAREGEEVRFKGQIVLDDTWVPAAKPGSPGAGSVLDIRQVRGIPAAFTPTPGGFLEIRIDARCLFDGADFSNITGNPADPADPAVKLLIQSKTGSGTDQVSKALYNRLRASRDTYSARWTSPPLPPLPASRGEGEPPTPTPSPPSWGGESRGALTDLVADVPPHLTADVPPHLTADVPPHLTADVPPHPTADVPPHPTADVPPHLTVDVPPHLTADAPPDSLVPVCCSSILGFPARGTCHRRVSREGNLPGLIHGLLREGACPQRRGLPVGTRCSPLPWLPLRYSRRGAGVRKERSP